MNKFLLGIIIIGLGLTLGANIVSAQSTPTLRYVFPCTNMLGVACPTPQEASQCPAAYIARFYIFALGIAGMLAFAMIIFGAIQYIVSAGSPTAQSDARDRIFQALWGVALLLGAWLILYTIDPALVDLKCSALNKQTIVPQITSSSTPSSTPMPPLTQNSSPVLGPTPAPNSNANISPSLPTNISLPSPIEQPINLSGGLMPGWSPGAMPGLNVGGAHF